MATRTGDLDPGVFVYLAREKGLSVDAIERLVERESGLVGVGGTADMETLLARALPRRSGGDEKTPAESDPAAALALALFGYAVRKAIGAFVAALGGIDLLVFTGGIGEHAAPVRSLACRGLAAFGIELDEARNARHDALIATQTSRAAIRVVAADEERVIARHAAALVSRSDARAELAP